MHIVGVILRLTHQHIDNLRGFDEELDHSGHVLRRSVPPEVPGVRTRSSGHHKVGCASSNQHGVSAIESMLGTGLKDRTKGGKSSILVLKIPSRDDGLQHLWAVVQPETTVLAEGLLHILRARNETQAILRSCLASWERCGIHGVIE